MFLSIIKIYFLEIITGLFIIFSAFIYYKPFSIERKEYIDFFPNFDILYVFIIGIIVIYHWFFSLIKAIRNKNQSSYENLEYNNSNDDISSNEKRENEYSYMVWYAIVLIMIIIQDI